MPSWTKQEPQLCEVAKDNMKKKKVGFIKVKDCMPPKICSYLVFFFSERM